MADNKQFNKSGNLDEKNNISDNDVVFEDENDENTPLQKIKKLREELKKCTEERGEYLAGWQRAKADFINQKKSDHAKQNRGQTDGNNR